MQLLSMRTEAGYWFEYGVSLAYGNSTPSTPVATCSQNAVES